MSNISFLQKYHYYFLAIIFVLLYSLGYLYINYDEKKRENVELVNALETTNIEYKLIYNIYKKNSRLVFKQFVNRADVLKIMEDINASNIDSQRRKLATAMKEPYTIAKSLGIKQLHFHLPNNRSFLRMHKPQKYGDDLSDFRYSVAYVNKKHRNISGFEQGKIVHGFRFVYPLRSKDKKHLGSVEVSVNTNNFKTQFENTIYVDGYFLINKKISEKKLFKDELQSHYIQSYASTKYLQEPLDQHDSDLKKYIKKHTLEYQNLLSSHLASHKAFSIEVIVNKLHYIQTFIPVKNIKEKKVVAYFVSTITSKNLKHIHEDALTIKLGLFLFLLLIIYALHKNLMYSHSLHNEIYKKTKELEASEQQIIQAKKMASLGTLVAGIAHEINTPVGISITAVSNFMQNTRTLKEHYDTEEMDQDEFEAYLSKTVTTTDLIFSNLVKTANLVKDFKQVSIHENSETKKDIFLKKHFTKIINTLQTHLEKQHVSVVLDVDENLMLHTYPDALSTIMTNIILNSIIHAFHKRDKAEIIIEAKQNKKQTIITYKDNGCGMNEQQVQNVFEPFYTTDRGSGGSGLGMHITFNLVTQKLGGTIDLTSVVDNGIEYTITI